MPRLLIRLTILYAILIGGLPVLQSTAYLAGGWTESRFLLAVFLALPLAAAYLVHRDWRRPGAILMLGSMSSGVVVNGLLFEGFRPPEFASPAWISVLRAWILLLMIVNVVLGWVALRILRDVHHPSSPDERPPAS